MKPLVLYHGNCMDGFTAAWCAWRATTALGKDAEFVPVLYGNPIPDVAQGDLSDRNVYLLDFSYPLADMVELAIRAKSLTVIDHHKSAEADLTALGQIDIPGRQRVEVVFDLDKSGARLTQEFFFPWAPGPSLVQYVEDRDLWRWVLPGSREINTAISAHAFNFEIWNDLAKMPLDLLLLEGQAMMKLNKRVVEAHVEQAREIKMAGHKVLVVNATVLQSEIAGKLAEGRAFGVCYMERKDGLRAWSLRSTKSGIDVSEIAKRFGGGGHAQAAGFETRGIVSNTILEHGA